MTAIAFESNTNSDFSLDDYVSAEVHNHGSNDHALWSPITIHIDPQDDQQEDEHDQDDDYFEPYVSRNKRRRLCNDGASVTTCTAEDIPKSGIVVAFSGFKESTALPNNFEVRDKLLRMVERLGGHVVCSDADDLLAFDNRVTHIVAPTEARTPRVIVAALTGKWIVSPEWVLESNKKGTFVDEKPYGGRRTGKSPFAGEQVYLSPRFVAEDCKTSSSSTRKHSRRDYLQAFVETFGCGTIVQHSGANAKYWVVANDEQIEDDDDDDAEYIEARPDRMVMKWNEFVHFMYPTNNTDNQEDEGDEDDEEYESPKEKAAADPKEESRRKSGRRRSPSGSNRKESIEWNIEAEPAPCPFGCGRSYTSTIGMKSHLKRFHTDEQRSQSWEMPRLKFQCRYCQYHSDRRSNLERHLNRFHVSDYFSDSNANLGTSDEQIEGSDS